MIISQAISKQWAESLIAEGRAKCLPQHGILWLKVRPWKKAGQILVYTFDQHLGFYMKPYLSRATRKEWEA